MRVFGLSRGVLIFTGKFDKNATVLKNISLFFLKNEFEVMRLKTLINLVRLSKLLIFAFF